MVCEQMLYCTGNACGEGEMRGSQGMKGGSSSSQQPSPLQPAHLRLGSQPDSKAQQDASRPRPRVLDACASQRASSQQSLRGNDEPYMPPQAWHDVAQEGSPADAADVGRATSPGDARMQSSQHAVGGDAAAENGSREHKVPDQCCAAQQQEAQQQHQTQQVAEHQPWEEAVQLLHSLACQISKRGGTPEQHSQASQPGDSSRQPKHASQPAGSAPSLQPSSGMEASQGQLIASRPGETTSTSMATSSKNVSQAQGGQQAFTSAAAAGTAQLQASQPGLTEQPSHSCPSTVPPSHSLGFQWTPESEHSISQHSAGPSQDSQRIGDRSDVQTMHGTSIDVGGPDDLPGARPRRSSPARESPHEPTLDSSAARTAPHEQPGSTVGTQTTSQSQPGAEQRSGSTSAEDARQGREGTQATQVEGNSPGAGQTELTLCLQLSSEDQDLACGQQPSASLHPTGTPGPRHNTSP